MTWYHWEGNDLILRLRIQPKASRDAFVAPYGEHQYKVTLTSPPADGKANLHLIKFLAKQFGLNRAYVILESGKRSRSKSVRLKSPSKWPLAYDESADCAGKIGLGEKPPGRS